MYTGFFGLTQEPFSIAPDPRYLFMSERHREALAHLLYGLQAGGGGFVLLTGEIGAGKTTLCRCLLEQVPRRCNVAYVFNPRQTALELLGSVCREFHVEAAPAASLAERIDALNEYLLKTHAVGQRNVLIIDEAQSLSADVLEQLRLLTNLETSERKLLQIILIGQPELRALLAQPALAQLAQRVVARYHLQALSEAETAQYIGHRLAVAGHSGPMPFDRGALRLIHRLSRGVPRRINLLCDRALLGAYAREQRVVDRRIVAKAAREVFDGAGGGPATRRAPLPRWAVAGLALCGGAALAVVGVMAVGGAYRPAPLATALAASSPAPAPARAPAPALASASASAPALASAPAGRASPASAPPDAAGMRPEAAWPEPRAALQALAARWAASGGGSASADACGAAAWRGPVRCYSGQGSLALLRQLGRPVALRLSLPDGPPAYVVLVGLTPRSALLQTRGGAVAWPLPALAERWRGEFSTFWRAAPEGPADAAAAASEPPPPDAIDAWRAQQLATLQPGARAPRDATGAGLRRRVMAFQRLQGLEADGVVGPLTAMLLNQAAGVREPRLLQEP